MLKVPFASLIVVVVLISCRLESPISKASTTSVSSTTISSTSPNLSGRDYRPLDHGAVAEAPGATEWFNINPSHKPNTIQVQVDVCVQSIGSENGEDLAVWGNRLFFTAMQVNFGPAQRLQPYQVDGIHAGLIYSGPDPYEGGSNAIRKFANFGGYFAEYSTPGFRYTPFFNSGPNLTTKPNGSLNEDALSNPVHLHYTPEAGVNVAVGHFSSLAYTQVNERMLSWDRSAWYKLRVYRTNSAPDSFGYYHWNAIITHASSNTSYSLGAVYTKADYIDGFQMWVETDSTIGNTIYDVRTRNPRYYLKDGSEHIPDVAAIRIDLTVHKNLSSSVVIPSSQTWNNTQEVWLRNGLPIPANALFARRYYDESLGIPAEQ